MKNYGVLIKEERKKRNWTQQIVAEKISVTKEAIKLVESLEEKEGSSITVVLYQEKYLND